MGMYKVFQKDSGEKGNALVLILIAVALFGYLSFAVTQSSQHTSDPSSQRAYLDASDIIKYAAYLASAVERVNLANHCRLSEMSFDHIKRENYNASSGDFYYNSNAPADGACHIFNANGGSAAYEEPPESSQDVGGVEYNVQSDFAVHNVGTDGGNAGVDVTLTTFVTPDVCLQINKIMGNKNPSNSPPEADLTTISVPGTTSETFPNFVDFSSTGIGLGTSLGAAVGNAEDLAGRPTGCFYASGDEAYIFYSVLMPR